MRPLFPLFLVLLWGCPQEVLVPPDKNETGEETDDPDDTSPDDTETGLPTDDQDGDGYTIEEGDCDDTSPYVSPARDEEPDDLVDNDCDGRVDEEWSGLSVSMYNLNKGESSWILTIDRIGNLSDQVDLSDPAVLPLWIDAGVDGGWVANDSQAYVTSIDSAGNTTTLADFSKSDNGIYGIATHPDGYYLTSTLGQLWRVDPDGTSTMLAEWNADFKDPEGFELAAYTIACDPLTGEVGLFGYFGGFATWSEADGFTLHLKENLKAKEFQYAFSGAHKDGGGWFTILYEDATGLISMARFNITDGAWEVKSTWTQENWSPNVLAIDGDSGDYYVTINSGWYHTVWRMMADGSGAWDFFVDYDPNDGASMLYGAYGIVSNY